MKTTNIMIVGVGGQGTLLASKLLGRILLEKGYDVYGCFCPLFPEFKMEHIIIPELHLACITENDYHYSIDDESKRIHATRFFDGNAYTKNREKSWFVTCFVTLRFT